MGGGDVDGTTPGCLDGDTGEAREQPAEALGCPRDRSRILAHLVADPAHPGSPPHAAAAPLQRRPGRRTGPAPPAAPVRPTPPGRRVMPPGPCSPSTRPLGRARTPPAAAPCG